MAPLGRPAKQKLVRPADDEVAEPAPRVGPVRRADRNPIRGEWLWTTRDDAERDLWEELELLVPKSVPRVLDRALVVSLALGDYEPTFARQGFPIEGIAFGEGSALADSAAALVVRALPLGVRFAIQAWVPDTDDGNLGAGVADALESAVHERLTANAATRARLASVDALRSEGGHLVQLALDQPGRAFVGGTPLVQAHSVFAGGRARMRVGAGKPSRAARKVEEALQLLGVQPSAGESCVDLGAAPGGWSWVLLEKRARVIAVDPAMLRPDLYERRGLRHVKESAFTFEPEETVDWLFCDMAWRPLEAAALLAKWARRHWARMLVANLKLPMKRKAEMAIRLREVLADGGWTRIRMRQLYHDRDEITVVAARG